MLERMIADAKVCNSRLKTNKNTIDLKYQTNHQNLLLPNKVRVGACSLSTKEIEDILFQKQGLVRQLNYGCRSQHKTVRKYDADYRGTES